MSSRDSYISEALYDYILGAQALIESAGSEFLRLRSTRI